MHVVCIRPVFGAVDDGVCGVQAWLSDRRAGSPRGHLVHAMRSGQVLDDIDVGVCGVCCGSIRGVDGLERVVGVYRMRGWSVHGVDRIDICVGLRGVHCRVDDGYTVSRRRDEVHSMHGGPPLAGLQGGMCCL